MNLNNQDIYTLLAKSLTDDLSEEERTELERWKQENASEYNDLFSLWSPITIFIHGNAICY